MDLSNQQKKQYRALGHKLKPVVMIADKGLSDGVKQELERALEDHELIKIKLSVNDPAERPEGQSEKKRFYRITPDGARLLAADAERLKVLATRALTRLGAGTQTT